MPNRAFYGHERQDPASYLTFGLTVYTMHFFVLMPIPILFILFITSLRIVFDGSGDAITCQRAKHKNATSRVASFKIECAKHVYKQGSIHHLDYDGDVFTCIQRCYWGSV